MCKLEFTFIYVIMDFSGLQFHNIYVTCHLSAPFWNVKICNWWNIRNVENYQSISKLMIFSRTKLNSGANLFRIKVLVDQKFNDVISILNNPSITFSQCGGIICKEQWTNLSLKNKDFWPIVIKKCSSRDSFYWLMLILLKITPDLLNLIK